MHWFYLLFLLGAFGLMQLLKRMHWVIGVMVLVITVTVLILLNFLQGDSGPGAGPWLTAIGLTAIGVVVGGVARAAGLYLARRPDMARWQRAPSIAGAIMSAAWFLGFSGFNSEALRCGPGYSPRPSGAKSA